MFKTIKKELNQSSDAPELVSVQYFVGIIAMIAFLLPLVLYFGDLYYTGRWVPRSSISGYYYSEMGGLFVGAIFIVGAFLLLYQGFHWIDNWVCNIGALGAFVLALCPTQLGENDTTEILTKATAIIGVHEMAAALLFIILCIISLFIFTNDREPGYWRNDFEFKTYFTCGLLMSLCMIAMVVVLFNDDPLLAELQPIFLLESLALFIFGISWGRKAIKVSEISQKRW